MGATDMCKEWGQESRTALAHSKGVFGPKISVVPKLRIPNLSNHLFSLDCSGNLTTNFFTSYPTALFTTASCLPKPLNLMNKSHPAQHSSVTVLPVTVSVFMLDLQALSDTVGPACLLCFRFHSFSLHNPEIPNCWY